MAGRGDNRTFCGGFCDNIKKGRRKADFAPRQEERIGELAFANCSRSVMKEPEVAVDDGKRPLFTE